MKCTACGYEKVSNYVKTAEVVRFKKGKRKGEIKSIQEDSVDIYAEKPEFIKIKLEKDAFEFVIRERYDDKEISLYACPECGTVRMERW